MKAVGKVGLRLNVDKTVILTNEAQPPNTLVTKDGLILKVLERNQRQKWLGCILTACGSMMQHLDLAYHMEQGILEFWVLLRCLPLLRWVGSLVLIRPSWEVSIRAPEAPALAAAWILGIAAEGWCRCFKIWPAYWLLLLYSASPTCTSCACVRPTLPQSLPTTTTSQSQDASAVSSTSMTSPPRL